MGLDGGPLHRASEFSGVRGRDGPRRRTFRIALRTAGRWGWTADFRKKPTFSVSDTGGSRVRKLNGEKTPHKQALVFSLFHEKHGFYPPPGGGGGVKSPIFTGLVANFSLYLP